MKKNIILGIMALAALASCSKSEIINEESLQEKGITFSAYVATAPVVKASTIDATNAATAGIGLFAWRTGNEDATDQILTDNAPAFMPNFLLTLASAPTTEGGKTYAATYTPVRYWPSTGAKVSFYAYAPYATGTTELPAGTTTDNNTYHPENITFTNNAGGAHKLTLNVPKGEENTTVYSGEEKENPDNAITINTGNIYNTQTDFMVARVGNGENNTGTNESSVYVGVNQNLTKEHTGAVTLTMKHALSKISFEVKAGNQNTPYANAKVVFDHIIVNGAFFNSGTYNLFTETWSNLTGEGDKYGFVNTFGATADAEDPFNPIADEVYNIQKAADVDADETNTPDANGWYKLNKSSHDLMVIPFTAEKTPATITGIQGRYMVQTFVERQKTDESGNLLYAEDGVTPLMESVEEESYRDYVPFTTTLDTPISLEAGKSYIFRLNIELKEISFEVIVEDWGAADNSPFVIGSGN